MEQKGETLAVTRRLAAQGKDKANQAFKDADYKSAVQGYTIEIKRLAAAVKRQGGFRSRQEREEVQSEAAVFYSNRAAAYLHLNNYAAVIDDCTTGMVLIIISEREIGGYTGMNLWDCNVISHNQELYLKLRRRRSEAFSKIGNHPAACYDLTRANNLSHIDGGEKLMDLMTMVNYPGYYRSKSSFRSGAKIECPDNQDILFVSGCLERPPGASGFSQMDKHTVEPAVCCYQKKIYVFGGKNFWTHETDGRKLLCYDTTTGNCERIPLDKSRWPMGRSGARGVVYEDSWYLYGGELDERGSTQNLFWKFHFPTRKWSKINPKNVGPGTRESHTAHVWNNKMIICCGSKDRCKETADIWEYDFAANEWKALYLSGKLKDARTKCGIYTLPWPRTLHASWLIGDNLYVFCGTLHLYNEDEDPGSHDKYFDDLWQFSLTSKTWKRCKILGNFPLRRAEFDSVHFRVNMEGGKKRDLIYCYGGYGAICHAYPPSPQNPNGMMCPTSYFGDAFELELMSTEDLQEEERKSGRGILGEFTVQEGDVVFRSKMVLVDDVNPSQPPSIPPQPPRAGIRLVADESEANPHFYIVGGYTGFPQVSGFPEILKMRIFKEGIMTERQGEEKDREKEENDKDKEREKEKRRKRREEKRKMQEAVDKHRREFLTRMGEKDPDNVKVNVVKMASCTACGKYKPSKELMQCGGCGKEGPRYCNRDCQKRHWPTHKPDCVAMKNKKK